MGTKREKQLLRFDLEKTPTEHLSINLMNGRWAREQKIQSSNVTEFDLIGVVAHWWAPFRQDMLIKHKCRIKV